MTRAVALIDGNNFYAACEQMIDPSLAGKPVVVLSNNDGCVISRSAEARKLRIAMGTPYFKINKKLEELEVKVCSSNYELYGDMSSRLMSLIKSHCEELEIYSIDEAFVKITRPKEYDLKKWARELRALLHRNLGLSIAIGIGKNKVQAKIANYLSKTLETYAGIFDLNIEKNQDNWLEIVSIENVWGIGNQLAYWCRLNGVTNAKELRDMPSNLLHAKYGVTGLRIQKELLGDVCIGFNLNQLQKKETCVSKSFSRAVTSKEELRQALANHVARASEKLRRQRQLAGKITIYTRTSTYTENFYSKKATIKLNTPSNDSNILLKASLSLIDEIYHSNYSLIKAGVLMQDLQNIDYIQQDLREPINIEMQLKKEKLMQTIDMLNNRYGNSTISWAICGTKKDWDMKRNKLTPARTTKLKDIPIVKA